jgi:hypothetical protein
MLSTIVVRTGDEVVVATRGLYCSYYESESAKPLLMRSEDAYGVVEVVAVKMKSHRQLKKRHRIHKINTTRNPKSLAISLSHTATLSRGYHKPTDSNDGNSKWPG